MKLDSALLSKRQYASFGPFGVVIQMVNAKCFRSGWSGCNAAMHSAVAAPNTGVFSFFVELGSSSPAHCGNHLLGVFPFYTSSI